ncbi:hypothetical protein JOF29_002895 [Kribbella aluminosa]|uniref:Uncharacterized protein n=1 Tax=Kribbella aluminosa TaxID=416017 RepID=A0ABS4UJH8_9ACTN|nr:hypothetical protein [Kribbella aluminosa]MBP2351812.1 hypothetical protein [Kribbella aluminosa]
MQRLGDVIGYADAASDGLGGPQLEPLVRQRRPEERRLVDESGGDGVTVMPRGPKSAASATTYGRSAALEAPYSTHGGTSPG